MKFFFDIKRFVLDIFRKKSAIYELARRDFQEQNKSTYLGIVWGYIQPLVYIFLLVLVFGIGLRTNPGGKVPFMIFLICGILPFQLFSSSLIKLTSVVKSYAFLVKKGDFSLSIIHIAILLSAMLPHVILIIAAVFLSWAKGFSPDLYSLQALYYLAGMLCLLLGLGWITSSTRPFIPDVHNVAVIITQFGFWLTPIIWNFTRVPEKYRWIIKLNPMWYVVEGYRDSIIYKVPFWSKPYETLYFWGVTATVLLLGVIIFRRLKPHFGEVI